MQKQHYKRWVVFAVAASVQEGTRAQYVRDARDALTTALKFRTIHLGLSSSVKHNQLFIYLHIDG